MVDKKCEFHDEAFSFIRDGIREIKEKLCDGSDQFRDLEKRKLGWATFTWIIGILIVIWIGIQGVMYSDIKEMGKQIINLDKKVAVYLKINGIPVEPNP